MSGHGGQCWPGQAPRGRYWPAITRQVHRDEAGLRQARQAACVSVSLWGWWPGTGTAHSSCGRQAVVAQHKISSCEKGESAPVEHPHSTIRRALPRVTRTPREGCKCVSSRTFLVMDAFLCNVQTSSLFSSFQHRFLAQFLSLLKVWAAFWM